MVNVINPWKSGGSMGEDLFGIGGLTEAFFGPKASQTAYTREKFKEAARQNEYTPRLAESVRLLGTPGGNVNTTLADAIMSGTNPEHIATANLVATTANNPNDLGGNTVLAAQMGNKVPIGATIPGNTANLENARTIAQMQADKAMALELERQRRTLIPTIDATTGLPTLTTTATAAGQRPVLELPKEQGVLLGQNFNRLDTLNPFQRAAIHADPKADTAVWNWVGPDGTPGGFTNNRTTDALTGKPLPYGAVLHSPSGASGLNTVTGALGKTQQGDLDESIIAGEESLSLFKQIIPMVEKNPNIVGPTGNALRLGQNVTDVVGSLHSLLGGTGKIDQDLTRARQMATQYLGADAAKALLPELYSGDLNKIETLHGLLTYKMARALNKGGALSNMDVDRARALVGTPDSWIKGPTEFIGRMKTAEEQVQRELADNMKRRQTNKASIGPALAPAAAPSVAPPSGFVVD